jgi:hypothetical protein
MSQRLPLTAQVVEIIGAAVRHARMECVSDALIGLLADAHRTAVRADHGRRVARNWLDHDEVTPQTDREIREMRLRQATPLDAVGAASSGQMTTGRGRR